MVCETSHGTRYIDKPFIIPSHFASDCKKTSPLGMQDGTIADDQITASSVDTQWQSADPDKCCSPWFARLNQDTRWQPNRNITGTARRWIKIDLRNRKMVTGIMTQGWGDAWVESVSVQYENPAGSGQLEYVNDEDGTVKVCVFELCKSLD